jgi:hypothetical protein
MADRILFCQDDELRWPAVIMRAEAYDIDFSHKGRKIAGNLGENKRQALPSVDKRQPKRK